MQLDCAIPDLEAELKALLAQIPPGRVTTYGDLADALGTRNAARWVGEFLREHEHGPACACHRVVRKDGELGLYVCAEEPGGKEARLRSEGVSITGGVVVDFESRRFRGFRCSQPLAELIRFQSELARRVRCDPFDGWPRLSAGLDVSYRRDGVAVGACAVVDTASGEVVWSTTRRQPASLPYIPTLLTFRELPMLLLLYEEVRRHYPELGLCLVDGNGILHPRGAGVAACFGVMADIPTIGVAKSLLCGRLESIDTSIGACTVVTIGENIVGAALQWGRSRRPLYVSPGQRIDVASASRITEALDRGHRLPEPLYWADRLSRAEARRAID